MTDINCHLELQRESVENFMAMVDFSKEVCKHKLRGKGIYTETLCFSTNILPP